MQPSQSPRKLSLTKAQRHKGQHLNSSSFFVFYCDLSRLLLLRLNIGAIGAICGQYLL